MCTCKGWAQHFSLWCSCHAQPTGGATWNEATLWQSLPIPSSHCLWDGRTQKHERNWKDLLIKARLEFENFPVKMKKKPNEECLRNTSGSIWNWWQPARKNPVASLIPDNNSFWLFNVFISFSFNSSRGGNCETVTGIWAVIPPHKNEAAERCFQAKGTKKKKSLSENSEEVLLSQKWKDLLRDRMDKTLRDGCQGNGP